MSWVLQALAQLLGSEPAPSTPALREAYMRSCKLLTDAMAKPPAQRDVAWMLEEAKRNMRLRGEYHQAEAQTWRRELEVWAQRLAAWQAEPASACCPDFLRVHQRMLASLHAGAALLEAWARQSTVRLQALQEGRPPPPAPPPRLELHLPAGVPQELPPSIDRCTVCQEHLEHAMYRERFMQAMQDADGYHLLLDILYGSQPVQASACPDAAVLGAAGRAPAGDGVHVVAAVEQEAAAAEQEAAAAELEATQLEEELASARKVAAQLEQELASAREVAAQLEARLARARARHHQAQERAEERRRQPQQHQQQQQHEEPT